MERRKHQSAFPVFDTTVHRSPRVRLRRASGRSGESGLPPSARILEFEPASRPMPAACEASEPQSSPRSNVQTGDASAVWTSETLHKSHIYWDAAFILEVRVSSDSATRSKNDLPTPRLPSTIVAVADLSKSTMCLSDAVATKQVQNLIVGISLFCIEKPSLPHSYGSLKIAVGLDADGRGGPRQDHATCEALGRQACDSIARPRQMLRAVQHFLALSIHRLTSGSEYSSVAGTGGPAERLP